MTSDKEIADKIRSYLSEVDALLNELRYKGYDVGVRLDDRRYKAGVGNVNEKTVSFWAVKTEKISI